MAQFDHLVKAELSAPVFVGEDWVATAGLIDHRPRIWTSEERRMLESVVDMFGSSWQIERAEAQLADLLRAKDRFVASISHELRTPLSAVVGYTAELRERGDDFDADEQREMLTLIAEQADEVSNIVDDLLVAARAETAQVAVTAEPVDLGATVGAAMKSVPPAWSHHVTVRRGDAVVVSGDAGRIKQIVRNLLTNAHRHGGREITVDILVEHGVGLLRVSDSGAPIPEPEREVMFEAYRSLGTQVGPLPSIGLGLTVSRQLARLMGGDLTYRHVGESTFEVSLPLA